MPQLRLLTAVALLLATALPSSTQSGNNTFVNFEGALTSPIRISADNTRLYVLNNPDNRLSVFDVSNASTPNLIAEIPVGIEPVSVNPRTNDEVWVVNQESDSVSIVSVSKGIVIDTLDAKDEPSDVVFTGNHAFVSLARSNAINVYDVNTHALVRTIPLFGGSPRALAVSNDGQTVFAAFAQSGNATTLIGQTKAPAPPAPTNPALPPAPQTGIIVAATDPNWRKVIKFTMPDNDVALIDASRLFVTRYVSGVGTTNFGIAVQPGSGTLFVTNTDALNLIAFEPNLRGHIVNNRLSRINTFGTVSAFDLNPGINYTLLPNSQALATAIAQPCGIVFDSTGAQMYIAAFGTDRVALVDTNGNILSRIDLGSPGVNSAAARGPRGLAINNPAHRLYVMNRISNTLSVIDTQQNNVVGEMATGSFDPTPAVIRQGRGFLYDAKLSGNGTASCASCHIDAEMDHLAWNLGDPGGNLATVVQNGTSFTMHPMKGPMTTQTLRGLVGMAPYHWRGDRASFNDFNPAFSTLMGGSPLSDSDMNTFTTFINTVTYMPNPNQNLDRTLPTQLGNGNAVSGETAFTQIQLKNNNPPQTCSTCHAVNPGFGSNLQILLMNGSTQPFKVPQLRATYQKQLYNDSTGAQSIDGFGINHDGVDAGTLDFISNQILFPALKNRTFAQQDIVAFIQSLDTGTAPAVGYTRTITKFNVTNSQVAGDWSTLESQAAVSNIDLIAKGTLSGSVHGLLYQPSSGNYKTDKTGLGPFTRTQLVSMLHAGDTLTVMGVPPGSGVRMGIDRNLDGLLDGDSH